MGSSGEDEFPKPAADAAPGASGDALARRWQERASLATVAGYLVIAAAAWYLLKEFASLLRPLLLAVFLCYVILPGHRWLKRRVPSAISIVVLAGVTVGLIMLLALLIYSSAIELSEEMPHLIARAQLIIKDVERWYLAHLPPWLPHDGPDIGAGQNWLAGQPNRAVAALVSGAADTLAEAALVGVYLIFLLVEASSVSQRIEGAFTGEQPAQILSVVGNINDAMASYLRVKVKASLVLAIPVTVVLAALGVKFALMWGVLTFLLNFIPYLGSVVACGAPLILAFLQMDSFERPAIVGVLLIGLHSLSAYAVEPAMTGRAVGLRPLIILIALSFWSLCWGLIGMLLAVPLTVMVKIVLENVTFTRPFARLMADD